MNRSGLTLVEILVAIVIIAIAFMALASMQISNMQVTRDSQLASIATQHANDLIEQTTREIFMDIEEYLSECYGEFFSSICQSSGQLSANLSYQVSIESLFQGPGDDFLNEGLLRLKVIILDQFGNSVMSFTSFVSCYDVSNTPTLEQGEPCPAPIKPDMAGF